MHAAQFCRGAPTADCEFSGEGLAHPPRRVLKMMKMTKMTMW
jgi:hypothetical protein